MRFLAPEKKNYAFRIQLQYICIRNNFRKNTGTYGLIGYESSKKKILQLIAVLVTALAH
jgi:hypothetical protein